MTDEIRKSHISLVRHLALRSINCRRMAKSIGKTIAAFGYECKADAYRRAAKVVAVDLGLCKGYAQ